MRIKFHNGEVVDAPLMAATAIGFAADAIDLDFDDIQYLMGLDKGMAKLLWNQLESRVHRVGVGLTGKSAYVVHVDGNTDLTGLRQALRDGQNRPEAVVVPPEAETPASDADRRVFERVHFRLILMPCCGHMFCGVNPRLPNYCVECGTRVYPEVKSSVLVSDDNAGLKRRLE